MEIMGLRIVQGGLNKGDESIFNKPVTLDADDSRNKIIIGNNYDNNLSGGDGNDII